MKLKIASLIFQLSCLCLIVLEKVVVNVCIYETPYIWNICEFESALKTSTALRTPVVSFGNRPSMFPQMELISHLERYRLMLCRIILSGHPAEDPLANTWCEAPDHLNFEVLISFLDDLALSWQSWLHRSDLDDLALSWQSWLRRSDLDDLALSWQSWLHRFGWFGFILAKLIVPVWFGWFAFILTKLIAPVWNLLLCVERWGKAYLQIYSLPRKLMAFDFFLNVLSHCILVHAFQSFGNS